MLRASYSSWATLPVLCRVSGVGLSHGSGPVPALASWHMPVMPLLGRAVQCPTISASLRLTPKVSVTQKGLENGAEGG